MLALLLQVPEVVAHGPTPTATSSRPHPFRTLCALAALALAPSLCRWWSGPPARVPGGPDGGHERPRPRPRTIAFLDLP